MISSRSQQPTQESENSDDYDRLFVSRVHRLVKRGYDRLTPSRYLNEEETAITGDLVESINVVLDAPVDQWMRYYSVHDDPPVNEPVKRGKKRRRGKQRKRVDIRFDSSEVSPRTRFRFECKRLGARNTVKDYLDKDGLGCFLGNAYAREDVRAGMLGYFQRDDEDCWANTIEGSLKTGGYSCRGNFVWLHAPVTSELPHTYLTTHGRGKGRKNIQIYHSLLQFY